MTACRFGAALAQATIFIMGFCVVPGVWFALEHPNDCRPPVTLLFVTDVVRAFASFCSPVSCHFDQ
eukprot:9409170-Lingulodinium_polyedra.AAC.1